MPVDSTTYQKYYNALQQAYGQNGTVEKGAFNLGYDDFKTKIANQDYAQKIYGALQHAYGDDGAAEKGAFTLPFQDFYGKVQPKENPLTSIRQLQQQATQPVRSTTTTLDPLSGGSMTTENKEDIARNEQFKQQYQNKVEGLAVQWGFSPSDVGQVLSDFPDEMRPEEIKSHTQIKADNPAMYDRLKDANAIRLQMSKSGPEGVHDANVFNTLQQSDNYEHFLQNLEAQKQLIAKHGMGQNAMDLLAGTQAPLFNAADEGMNQKHYSTADKDLGLSKYQYAGLEYERAFHPEKAKMDEELIRQTNKGEEPGWTGANYELARGIENAKYNLEMIGRNNTGRYLAEHKTNNDKQLTALTDHYNELIKANPENYAQLAQEYNNNPIVKQAQRLDEATKDLQYAATEDERKFPLNTSDKATRLVKDAMASSTMGDVGKWVGHVAYSSGESADNTLKFIENTAINILGNDEDKTLNYARNTGDLSLKELTQYEPEAYTGVKSLLNVPNDVKKGVQDIFNDPSLSSEQAQQKAISYVRDNMDNFTVNRDAGHQNLTGKVALFKSADMLGQILGIAAQSYALGGVFGNASKWQRMASAFTPMFTSTQNQMYQEALSRGDTHPLLRSTTDAAIVALAGLINPDIDVVKKAVGVNSQLGKAIAGVEGSTWNQIVSRNSALVDRFAGALKGFGRQMGLANLQYGLLVPTAQYGAHRALFGEEGNLTQSIKDNLVQTSLTMAIPSILHGAWGGIQATEVNPLQKMALVEAGLKPQESIASIDNQVKEGLLEPRKAEDMKRVIKMTGDILENTEGVKSDGSLMNEKEVADLTYSLVRKKVMEGQLKSAAEPQKPIIEDKLRELNQHISDLHTADADKQKTELNQLLSDNLEKIRQNKPEFVKKIEDAIKENRPEDVFRLIAEEAQEKRKVGDIEVNTRGEAEATYGKKIVDKAIEISKQKTKTNGKETEGDAQAQKVAPTEGAITAPSFLESRHADTIHDEQGVVSGPNDKELSGKGKRDANDLANDVEGKGVTKIISSDLERGKETAKIVADKTGATVEHRPELNTWDIGDFDGTKDAEFKDIQRWFVEHPDAITYEGDISKDRGKSVKESFNQYKDRVIQARTALEKEPGSTLVINHSNNMMLWDAYEKNGRQWSEKAANDYLNAKTPEPATLTKKSNVSYPKITNVKLKQDAIQEPSTTGILQHPQEGIGIPGGERGRVEPSIEGQEPPGARITEEEGKGAGEEKERITGIAQRVQEQLGLRKYEKGEGWTPEEAFAFGKAAIAQGADPVKAMTDPAYANLDLGERLAIAQAHNYTLHNDIVKAENDFGIESDQYKDAVNKQDEYLKLVQKLKTESSRAFTAQQGQIDLDTGSFTSVKKAIEKKQGSALSEEQSAQVVELTKKNKDLSSKISALENRLKRETDESFGKAKEKPAPKVKKEKLSSKISDIAKRIRTSSEFDDFLKGPQGDVQKMGVDLPRLKEIAASILEDAAKAVKKGEDIAEFLKNAVDKIKEDIGDKDKFLEALHGIGEKTGLFDSKESPEEKEIKRLEKELSDLQQGIAKQKNPKSEDSDRAKQLKEQIKDERQKLGLTTSKSERPLSDEEKLLKSENDAKVLAEKFVDKKGNKFTPEEASSLWDYMKENYLDNGVNFRDAISQVSNDTGLSFEQVSNAIITPKTKPVSDAMWKHQYDLEKNRQATERYVNSQGQNPSIRAFKKVVNSFREVTVFGHGGIFVGTHAGMTLMDLPRAKHTVSAFFRAWKLAYGSDVYYQKSMTELKSSKNYTLAQRYGLKNNPDVINNDAEIIQPLFGKISESGKRGFNAIKILRQALFDAHYDALSVDEKADPGSAIAIAKLVNNATGASNLNIPDWVNDVTFAGGMEAARWGKLTRNPFLATKTALTALIKPESVSIEDRVFAKVWAKRVGTELASYVGLLTLNAAIQNSLTDDENKKVNLLNPNKSDWLKMKMGNTTFDFTSGMLSTLHFAESLAYQGATGEPVYKGESLPKSFAETGYKYGIGKLSPFYGDAIETATRHDYNGNTLPWSDAKPLHKFNHKLTWPEYISSKAPLPVAEGFRTFYDQANQQGVEKSKLEEILTGLKYGAISGGTGFKAYETREGAKGSSGDRGGGGGANGSFR